jgi:hypothetical protein
MVSPTMQIEVRSPKWVNSQTIIAATNAARNLQTLHQEDPKLILRKKRQTENMTKEEKEGGVLSGDDLDDPSGHCL